MGKALPRGHGTAVRRDQTSRRFIQVRFARPEDRASMFRLDSELRGQVTLKSAIEQGRCLVACSEGEVVAFVTWDRLLGSGITIRHLVVSRKYQRQGVARQLTRYLEGYGLFTWGPGTEIKTLVPRGDVSVSAVLGRLGFELDSESEFWRRNTARAMYRKVVHA